MKKILIANRGEIACRIIRTCQAMGIQSVLISSPMDATSPAMQMADIGVVIDEISPYLNITTILEVARIHQVDAIHPGYGFLSENAEFAEVATQAGFTFIGPKPDAIRKMGSKSEAKRIAQAVSVPIIPGFTSSSDTLQSADILEKEAQAIGFPLLIKATYGGGGKGMRRVDEAGSFANALASCQREALKAFGKEDVMLEKYVAEPRHIEVQIFGDMLGTVWALSERDCSLQRRHQKVIEEAPAAGLSAHCRQKLADAACAIAKSVAYCGAGTVEFLVTNDETFYFLEMNTRLQVEHPVTEAILGVDLVRAQLLVAQGQRLEDVFGDHPKASGHALEARLYAEDPFSGFLPSIGSLKTCAFPTNARVDSGVVEGSIITPYYDPMIAKIIVHAPTRAGAYAALRSALCETKIDGVTTNLPFLWALTQDPSVTHALPDIGYIDRLTVPLPSSSTSNAETLFMAAACGALWLNTSEAQQISTARSDSPWYLSDGWRLNAPQRRSYHLRSKTDEYIHTLTVLENHTGIKTVTDGTHSLSVSYVSASATHFYALTTQNICLKAAVLTSGPEQFSIALTGQIITTTHWTLINEHSHDEESGAQDGHLNAPMPGRILSVLVRSGADIQAGSPLLILEAMKMEHTIRAPYDGVVDAIYFEAGDFVEEGTELARLSAQK